MTEHTLVTLNSETEFILIVCFRQITKKQVITQQKLLH